MVNDLEGSILARDVDRGASGLPVCVHTRICAYACMCKRVCACVFVCVLTLSGFKGSQPLSMRNLTIFTEPHSHAANSAHLPIYGGIIVSCVVFFLGGVI